MTSPAPAAAPDTLTRPLRLLGLAGFASMAALRWCDSLLTTLAAEFHTSTGTAAATVAAYAVAYGVMQLVYGPLGDRLGKFRVVSLATLACTAGAVASALAPSLGWLVGARVATGAAAAAVIPLSLAWIGDRVPIEERQAMLARVLGATISGMIAGQWLAGVFADLWGWRAGFWLLAVLFGAAGLAMRWHLRQAAADTDTDTDTDAAGAPAALPVHRQMGSVLALPAARRLYAVTAVEGAFVFGGLTFVASLLQQRFGLSASGAGSVLIAYGLGGLLYSHGAKWLLWRWGSLHVAGAGGAVLGASWLALAAVPAWWLAPPLCAAAGLGFYMLHSALQTTGTQLAPAARGTAMSLFACALFFGQSLGVLLISWGVDRHGPALAMAVSGVGLPCVAWVFISLQRRGGLTALQAPR